MAATTGENQSGQVRPDENQPVRRISRAFPVPVTVPSLKLDRPDEIGVASLPELRGLIGKSGAMQSLIEELIRVSQSSHSVLLTGASGTGKTTAAKAIHDASVRAAKPFLAVNCAGIPESLLEAELFGYEKGAFTGATAARRGLFEAASGGTLFLDEIGDMPLQMQAKLLTAIEEKQIRRLGSTSDLKCDVRIITATKRDLRAMIGEGTFREDLYYRIAVLEVDTPALKERKADIPILVEHYLKEEARAARQADNHAIQAEGMELLTRHDWPGNIRELRNVIARLTAEAKDELTISTNAVRRVLNSATGRSTKSKAGIKVCAAEEVKPDESLDQYLDRVTISAINAAIAQTGSAKSAAARLKINRTNLYGRMKLARQSQPIG